MVEAHQATPLQVPRDCPEALLLDPMVERRSRRFFDFSKSSKWRFVTVIGLFLFLAVIGSLSMNHSEEPQKAPEISSEEIRRLQRQSYKWLYNDLLESYHKNVRLPIHQLAAALEPLTTGKNLTDEERIEAEGSCGVFKPSRIAYAMKEVQRVCEGTQLNKEVFDFLHGQISQTYITEFTADDNRAREIFSVLYFMLDSHGSMAQHFMNIFRYYHTRNVPVYQNVTSLLETFYRETHARHWDEAEEVKTQCLPLAIYVATGFKGDLVVQLRDEIVDHVAELKRLTEICSKTEAHRGQYEYMYKMRVRWAVSELEDFVKKYIESLLHQTWPDVETYLARAIIREKYPVGTVNWDNTSLSQLAEDVYLRLKGIGHPDYDHQVVIFSPFLPMESMAENAETPNFYCLPNVCSTGRESGVKVLLIRQKPLEEERRRHLNNFADKVDLVFRNAFENDGYRLNVPLPQMELKYRVRFSEYERHSALFFLSDHGWISADTAFGVAGQVTTPPAFRTVGYDQHGLFSYKYHWSFLIF